MTVVSTSVARRLASTRASVVGSSAEVVSSRSNSCGRLTSARASAMRCRCPPDRPTPRSPTTVPVPSARSCTNDASAVARASLTASSVSGRPSATLSRTEPAKRNGSWKTTDTVPSGTVMVPPPVVTRPAMAWTNVVLPAPVAPTTATVRPPAMWAVTPRSTSRSPSWLTTRSAMSTAVPARRRSRAAGSGSTGASSNCRSRVQPA